MSSSNTLSAFLYCSTLDPTQPISTVADIVKAAREKNTQLQLTGILIFDGQCFCQYLEGPESAISSVLASIYQDQRHADVNLQFHGPVDGERQFKDWAIAYAELEQDLSLEHITEFQGDEALHLSSYYPVWTTVKHACELHVTGLACPLVFSMH